MSLQQASQKGSGLRNEHKKIYLLNLVHGRFFFVVVAGCCGIVNGGDCGISLIIAV